MCASIFCLGPSSNRGWTKQTRSGRLGVVGKAIVLGQCFAYHIQSTAVGGCPRNEVIVHITSGNLGSAVMDSMAMTSVLVRSEQDSAFFGRGAPRQVCQCHGGGRREELLVTRHKSTRLRTLFHAPRPPGSPAHLPNVRSISHARLSTPALRRHFLSKPIAHHISRYIFREPNVHVPAVPTATLRVHSPLCPIPALPLLLRLSLRPTLSVEILCVAPMTHHANQSRVPLPVPSATSPAAAP